MFLERLPELHAPVQATPPTTHLPVMPTPASVFLDISDVLDDIAYNPVPLQPTPGLVTHAEPLLHADPNAVAPYDNVQRPAALPPLVDNPLYLQDAH